MELTKEHLAKKLLLSEMSRLSEEYWSAGWLIDLEYILWECCLEVTKSLRDYLECKPYNYPNSQEIEFLHQLATICDGWWSWNKEKGIKDFIPLKDWFAQYEKRQKETKIKEPIG